MKYLFIIFFTFINQNTFAGCNNTSCNNVKIEMLYVAAGITYIKTDGIETDLDNCGEFAGFKAIEATTNLDVNITDLLRGVLRHLLPIKNLFSP